MPLTLPDALLGRHRPSFKRTRVACLVERKKQQCVACHTSLRSRSVSQTDAFAILLPRSRSVPLLSGTALLSDHLLYETLLLACFHVRVGYQERCESKRQEFIAQIALHNSDEIVYVDESGMDNRDDYGYGWNERGERFHALKSGRRQGRVNMIAALCHQQLMAPFTIEGSSKTRCV